MRNFSIYIPKFWVIVRVWDLGRVIISLRDFNFQLLNFLLFWIGQMFLILMLNQLILPIILAITKLATVDSINHEMVYLLLVVMATFMVSFIPYWCKTFVTVLTEIRSVIGMHSQVDSEVTLLCEEFVTKLAFNKLGFLMMRFHM